MPAAANSLERAERASCKIFSKRSPTSGKFLPISRAASSSERPTPRNHHHKQKEKQETDGRRKPGRIFKESRQQKISAQDRRREQSAAHRQIEIIFSAKGRNIFPNRFQFLLHDEQR